MTQYRFVIEALTPICHFDTASGIDNATNIRLSMRSASLIDGRLARIATISENALRTSMLRIPLAHHLIHTLGIAGQVPRAVLNLLYSGGLMASGGRAPGDETVLGHAIGALYPNLALLGGAVDTFILPRGKLRMTGFVVCREHETALKALFPEEVETAAKVSVFDLPSEEVRVRGTGSESVGNQMLYGYEVLPAGTRIAVEMTVDTWAKPQVVAAIARALTDWDGFIGGQGRQGRGRCIIHWLDESPSFEAYDNHIVSNAEAMRDGLISGTLGAAKTLCAA